MERMRWKRSSGAPAIRLIFDPVVGAPETKELFTRSVTLAFTHPGIYPYTVFKGGGKWPWPIRGEIVVK